MGTKKQKAKGNKAIVKANQNALKGFEKRKLVTALATMHVAASDADVSTEAKAAAAVDVVAVFKAYRAKNADAQIDTVLTGLRDEIKVVAMELALAGNRFAELTEAKDDKPATAKLTGYGANVVSIAKGAVEFDLDTADKSYRDIRKAVEAERAEKRRAADPDAAALADAKGDCTEAWDQLRKAVFDTGDAGLVRHLETILDAEYQAFIEAQAAQDETEAEAEAANG